MAREHSLESGDWKRLRRGWCVGGKEFREELLEMLTERRSDEELHESDEQKAERLVMEMLGKARWKEQDLKSHRKGDPVKLRMADRLRSETSMSWRWIAQRLQMGHWRSAVNAVRIVRRSK